MNQVNGLKILLVALFLLSASSVGASVRHSIGIARAPDQADISYIEHHQYLQDGRHFVSYFDTDMNLLVTKELNYTNQPQHPELRLSDLRNSTEVRIESESGAAVMSGNRLKKGSFLFELDDDVVIDAGFDAYIRSSWESLAAEQQQNIRMVVAGVPNLIGMTISLEESAENITRFSITPRNWLIRLVLPRVDLQYDDSRQLMRYEGLSNLKQEEKASREVVITFSHHRSEGLLSAPPADWLNR